MGDIEKPGQVRTLEWLAAESSCREIVHSKADSTDFLGGEDPTTIAQVFAKDVEYTFTKTSRARGRTIKGREALAEWYASGLEEARNSQPRFHSMTNFQFTLVDPTHARSRCTMWIYRVDREDEPLLLTGIEELHHEFVLEDDGAWRISKLNVDVIVRRGVGEGGKVFIHEPMATA